MNALASSSASVSELDAATYQRDGVVCLRRVFDPAWLEPMMRDARRIAVDKADVGLLPTLPGRYMARRLDSFRRFIFDSPLGEVAAHVLRSERIRFFFDELFVKSPGSTDPTLWHTDRMGWPVTGKMVPSLWIPLTPVRQPNGLECVLGSQTQDVRYWLFSPNAQQMSRPPDRVKHPDGAKLRAEYGDRIRSWDMEPGDMLVVHPWTLHYSSGNAAEHWRFALSVRVFGDDIRWKPRPDCLNIAGVSFDEMVAGESPGGPLFPVLWSADGKSDTDALYPRGFATTWSSSPRDHVNDEKLFAALKARQDVEAT
jgi:ectoine hydroxylase-related dioxygenase (phytanoyl-CoA dioxygenase family)